MKAHIFRGLRHARRGLFYTSSAVLVLMAIAVAVADRLLPLVQENPDRIAAWLIEKAGRPVQFARAEAHWTRRGPVFVLHDVKIGGGKQVLEVDRAELLLAMYSGWWPDHPFTELRLRGLALTLQRDADGQWHFVGLSGPKTTAGQNPLHDLEGLGELQVADAKLTVHAPDLGIDFTSPRVDVRLRVTAGRLRAGVRAWASQGLPPLYAVMDFDRSDNSGKLWIGGNDVDLAPWSRLLAYAGVEPVRGRGKVGLWTTLKERRVAQVQADVDLRTVSLRSRMPTMENGRTVLPQVDLKGLSMSARWDAIDDGWRLVAPTLHLRTAAGDDTLDGLALQDADGIALSARHADIGGLLAIAALSEHAPSSLRGWLSQASPRLHLTGLHVAGRLGGAIRGGAVVEDASFKPVGETPGVQGLGGTLRFDRDAIAFDLDPHRPAPHALRILWPPAFGAPMPMELEGTLAAWRDDDAWTLESSRLRAHNADIDLTTRLSMRFDHGHARPRLDLFGTLQPAHLNLAPRYLIRHRMPDSVVAWIEQSVQGGEVLGAHVLVSGDLADWPFRNNEGRFEVVADLAGGLIRFHPDWPRAEQVSGRLSFVNESMRFEGGASILGINVPQTMVEIPSFKAPILELRAEGSASGPQMLGLLRRSPLNKQYGASFAALDAQGDAQHVTFHMLQPLKHELGERSLDGDVLLSHARLADKRWNLQFTDVDGRMHYDQGGVLADALSVHVNGDPGTLRLAIGAPTGDPSVSVWAKLQGTFPPTTLLQHAPSLDWLKPILQGRAAWTVEVLVPQERVDKQPAPSVLKVRSDLQGIEFALPAPLNKAAASALPLQVNTLLPADAGELDVELGDLMALRGRYDSSQTLHGLVVFGSNVASGELPPHGLVVSGRAPEVDAAGWISYANKSKEGTTGVQSIDLSADNLLLGGRRFPDIRVRMSRQPDATTLRMDGETMAGSVVAPIDPARAIRGQFDRLYWPGAAAPTASPTANVRGAAAEDESDLDPVKVPPIHLDVADLRFGDARLGHLVLQTHPISQGLHIDQLDATAKSQTLSAGGDWTRNGATTRTRLAIDFKAESLGKMLDAFGFNGVVAAGKTHAKLQAGWPGSPTAFRLSALDGTLDLDVGSGRLLEVKPGSAGRVLGLVSLAELPRRLTLDFRDFFEKGFAFDTLKGRFVFAGGVARTDDLSIKGPSADIKVSGSADLVAQKYDQTIDVLPKAGGLVTAVGAAVGGPVGAAVGAVASEVLKKPLQQMAHKRYHVTGPWANPDVQTVKGSTASEPRPASG
jgi:uncharacterized protein (TIGR02099 family)